MHSFHPYGKHIHLFKVKFYVRFMETVKNEESRSQYSRLNDSNFLKVKVFHFN